MSYYRRDSLSIKSNKILANLFAQLILLSQKVQSFRQVIASVPYYDCVQLFRVLDNNEKGYLTLKDFERLIGEKHKKIVTYVFSWFDQAKLGEISRLQFIAFLMPRRNQELRQMVARRIQQPVNDENFSQTINTQLKIFTQLLNQMISHELKIIEQRNLLLKQQDYTLKGVLNSIDVYGLQFVSTKQIQRFLKSYAIQATTQQLEDLLQIVDSRLKGKINLQQLKWIIEGLESKNVEYRQKVKSSIKKRSSSRRKDQKQQTIKQFIRTPLKSKQNNNFSQSIQQSKVSQTNKNTIKQSAKVQKSNYNSHQSSIKKQSFNHSIQKNQKLINSPYNQNGQYYSILQKYKQAEAQQLKKDAQLIRVDQQIRSKLREQFYEKSNQRKRAITQYDFIPSYSRKRPIAQFNTGKKQEFIKPQTSKRSIIQDSFRQFSTDNRYPYTSQYDKKINTIVQGFYRRNNVTAPLHYSGKKYGTLASSFYNQRDLYGNKSYGASSYDRHLPLRKSFVDEQLRQKAKVRPFDHGSTFVKQQIKKKLGDEICNIKLPSRVYDSNVHQMRQKPLQDSIRRLKQSTDRIQNQRKMKNLNGMMENISIISKQSEKKMQRSPTKNSQVQQLNIYKTDIKSRPIDTPLSGQQTISNVDWTKSRGQRTTQTKNPYGQTDNKMTPSLLKVQQNRKY